jgi:HJR/Mrr/RecB family endonuclease
MSRRRRYSRRDYSVGGIAVLLSLATGYVLAAFEQNPLLVSLSSGLLFTVVFWLIWTLLYRRRRKRSQWAASRQLYLELTDQDFEYAVAELFCLKGFKSQVTRRSNDRGISIYLKKNGQQAAVQCKQYKEPTGPDHIRVFIGALQARSQVKAGISRHYRSL